MKSNFSRERVTPKGKVSDAGQLAQDKFDKLWSNKEQEPARVSMTVSEGLDYGAVKVSATVTVSCDQNEATINKAGELAFFKALELMRDGWSQLGGPTGENNG